MITLRNILTSHLACVVIIISDEFIDKGIWSFSVDFIRPHVVDKNNLNYDWVIIVGTHGGFPIINFTLKAV